MQIYFKPCHIWQSPPSNLQDFVFRNSSQEPSPTFNMKSDLPTLARELAQLLTIFAEPKTRYISWSLLQPQKWIVIYYVKKLITESQ